MNGAGTSELARAAERVTRLRVADGPLLRPVLCRVVSMVLTRADWPLDRLEEALLACDAICAPRPEQDGRGRRLTFSIEADELQAELCVCDLSFEDAEELVREARLPLVGNVLERVADRVSVQREESGAGARLTIALSAR